MRVSDLQSTHIMLSGMSKSNAELSTLLQQMYSGEKLTKISDDPVASVKLLDLEQTTAEITQYINNAENVQSGYQRYEVHIESIENGLQSANELLLWGLNGSMSEQDRAGIVIELESLKESMLAAFNGKNSEGSYMFSGSAIDQAPYNIDAEALTLNPDINSNARNTVIADGISMKSNLNIEDVDAESILAMLDTSIAELGSATPDMAVLQGAHDDLLSSINKVSSTQAYIGSQINRIERTVGTHTDTELFAQKLEGDLKDLSYDEASLKLNNYMTALEATQKTFAQISSLSLFNQL